MNLSYRGISYQSDSPAVDVTESNQVGHFLGNSYKIQHGKVSHRQSSPALTYRGVTYNV